MWPLTHQINKYICMLGAGSISYSSLWACVVWVQILSWFDWIYPSYQVKAAVSSNSRSIFSSSWFDCKCFTFLPLTLPWRCGIDDQDDQTEALVWGFCLFVCFSCFGLFVFYCCWRKILPQPIVSICYWRCTTWTCEIIGRRQSLFLLKQLLIFIQKRKGRLFHTCEIWDVCWIQTPDICIEHYIL